MTDMLSPLAFNEMLGCPQPERDNEQDAERAEIIYCAMCAEPEPTPLRLGQYFFCFKCHCWQLSGE